TLSLSLWSFPFRLSTGTSVATGRWIRYSLFEAAQILTGGKEKNDLTFRENRAKTNAPGGWPRICGACGSGFIWMTKHLFIHISPIIGTKSCQSSE
ncbi:MAG: hypothetical protein J5787_10130, partial [Alphaproteobacteria bacterium]|nr:hypothetical protein [Alphaproteobacteria bacterium]